MSYIQEIKKVQTGYEMMGDVSLNLKNPEHTGNRINHMYEISQVELRSTEDIDYFFGSVPMVKGKPLVVNKGNVFEFCDGVRRLIPITIDEFICSAKHLGVPLEWSDVVFDNKIINAYPQVWKRINNQQSKNK